METIRFRNDTALRKRFFHESAMSHPAKFHCGLLLEILARYCPEPCTILDPMAGIGTLLLAAQYGHWVILNELEPHFLETIPKSWAKMQRNGPAMGHQMGQAVILRGDARCLPLPDASVGTAITSPPYQETVSTARHIGGIDQGAFSYTRRPVDAIISSPPYEGSVDSQKDGIDWGKQADGRKKQEPHGVGGKPFAYTRPVDTIITSPPFQSSSVNGITETPHGGMNYGEFSPNPPYNQIGTREAAEERGRTIGTNIGNLRNAAYWESMRQVYAECWRVLKPGGIMALVLKGFTRDGQYVDLPQQTAELCESLGFRQFDHWRRELWSLSFWRILQKRRDPAAWDDRLMYAVSSYSEAPLPDLGEGVKQMGKQSSEGVEDAAWHKDYERYRKKFLAEALAEGPLTGEDAFNIVSRAVGAANALKIDRMMMGPEAATFEEL